MNKKKLTESELGYSEVDSLIESAMRETLVTQIKESGLGIEDLEAVNSANFTQEQFDMFTENTVQPILKTVGTMESGDVLNNAKIKAVTLPVYEAALTLEAARRGALTEGSLEDTPIKESVEPDAQELASIIRDIVENGIKDETHGGKHKAESPMAGKVKSNKLSEAVTVAQLTDLHQSEKNKKKMALTSKSSMPKQPTRDKTLPKKVSDLHKFQGEVADDKGLYDTVDETLEEKTILDQIYNELVESCFKPMAKGSKGRTAKNQATTDPKVGKLHNFQGHNAGPNSEAKNDKNFKVKGTAGDIVKEQTEIAKRLLGRIFNEYGINDDTQKKAVIKEAVHNIFKYGTKNLVPSVSDVSAVVSYQNRLAESVEGEYTAKYIVENTEVELTEEHVDNLLEVGIDYADAVLEAFEVKNDYENSDNSNVTDEEYTNAVTIIESISFITTTNELERKRQAFRYRMNKFNENAKVSAASNWVVLESDNTFDELITVRRFISETEDLKKYFSVLKEDSPVYASIIKKDNNANDELTTAVVFTEAFIVWRKLKDVYYNNNAPLDQKLFALETALDGIEKYKSLLSSVKSSKSKMVFENFSYRLNSLKDKVLVKLNG